MSDSNGHSSVPGVFATIDDGYTEKGFIAGVPRLHPDIRFDFRRMTAEEHRKFSRNFRMIQDDRAAYYDFAAEIVADHVQAWNVMARKGELLPIVKAVIMRKLKPEIIERLLEIISGLKPSDHDPEWDKAVDSDEIEMSAGEKTPDQVDGERVKN